MAIPHLGASTPESEDNCAVMAAEELIDYLENGNITHSVNYPTSVNPRVTPYRVCVLHKNVPTMVSQISGSVSSNIEAMSNQSKKELAYTVLDVVAEPTDADVAALNAIDGVIRVRVLK